MSRNHPVGSIEAWVIEKPNGFGVIGRIVYEDESVEEFRDDHRPGYDGLESVSLRGAMRELTGILIRWGYEPVGRWERTTDGEAVRQFKPKT